MNESHGELPDLTLEELRCLNLNLNSSEDFSANIPNQNFPPEFQQPEFHIGIERKIFSVLVNNTSSFPRSENDTDYINQSVVYCPRHYDSILCWPETPAGLNASLPCFSVFNDVPYDTSYNATRFCDDGNWTKSEYGLCKALNSTNPDDSSLEITTGVYFYGYCLSLSALIAAMIIFIVIKELRCLRNTIHTNLIVTYILSDAMWILTSFTTNTSQEGQTGHNQVSCITFILLHYFHLTNFFWMFVEGLYLYVLVVRTFVAENIRLRVYAGIGWGLPLMVVIGWSIAKWMTQSASADIHTTDPEFTVSTCLWLTVSVYDWIYKAPAILVLAANILFLIQIMWVLITKLRSATNPETQQSRKAAKALVVLMPLLGITYVLILSGSRTPVYEHLRAFLISTQGFLVALLYCFLNGEVRLAVRYRWNRLPTSGLTCSRCTCCDCDRPHQTHHNRDLSPQTATENIGFYGLKRDPNRQRDSSVSETTLTTTFQGSLNGNSAGLGSSHRLSSSTHFPPATLLQKSPSSLTNTNVPLTVENNLYI